MKWNPKIYSAIPVYSRSDGASVDEQKRIEEEQEVNNENIEGKPNNQNEKENHVDVR